MLVSLNQLCMAQKCPIIETLSMSSVPVYPCAHFLGSGISISQNLGRQGLMFFRFGTRHHRSLHASLVARTLPLRSIDLADRKGLYRSSLDQTCLTELRWPSQALGVCHLFATCSIVAGRRSTLSTGIWPTPNPFFVPRTHVPVARHLKGFAWAA